jgi:chromate reductase, NAD(P)H dehydrogenase (quinone)
MTTYKIGYFVGSLSSKSINRILSKALIRLAPKDLEFSEIPIDNLPLYSQDYDDNYPAEATALKEAIAKSDAVLFVTPEYNRSIPGALKTRLTGHRGHGVKTPSTTFPPRLSAPRSARSAPPSLSRAFAEF